jgi:aerobic-type carbon monoxide dehydrogenase small subunit (CoxS/CutS family)
MPHPKLTRRSFLKLTGLGACAALSFGMVGGWASPALAAANEPDFELAITLEVNGERHERQVPTHRTLAEFLRDDLGLKGTKIGCNKASCGACTVHLNGQSVYSCHLLAAQANGARVTTIEGLSQPDQLHPLQQAFIDHDAAQCGFALPAW